MNDPRGVFVVLTAGSQGQSHLKDLNMFTCLFLLYYYYY